MAFFNYIILDEIKYDYKSGSWSQILPVRSSRNTTQTVPSFQYNGLDKGEQKINLLAFSWLANWGVTTTGISQLASLKTTLNKKGNAMPVLFVNPMGETYSVIPSGSLNITQYRVYGDSSIPLEFSMDITLDEA